MSDHNEPDKDLDELYRGGPHVEPPAELDRRILAAAGAASRRRRWQRRLAGPGAFGLASAAVLMLTVALLVRQDAAVELQHKLQAPPAAAPAAAPPGEPAPGLEATPGTATDAARQESDLSRDDAARELGPQLRRQPELRRLAESASGFSQLAPAAGRAAAPALGPPASDRDCRLDRPLPAGAVLEPVAEGLRVRHDGRSYTLSCRDGHWLEEPPADDPEPAAAEPPSGSDK